MKKNIHSGNMSYLTRVHKKYGVHEYNMYFLKRWADGKITVEFRKKENEEQK